MFALTRYTDDVSPNAFWCYVSNTLSFCLYITGVDNNPRGVALFPVSMKPVRAWAFASILLFFLSTLVQVCSHCRLPTVLPVSFVGFCGSSFLRMSKEVASTYVSLNPLLCLVLSRRISAGLPFSIRFYQMVPAQQRSFCSLYGRSRMAYDILSISVCHVQTNRHRS